jgi:peptidoglycan/xylan/chitin deacetylase (PgdA/CDA1 family)
MPGREIEQHRKIFTKTIEEGHEVGNHLYNHRPITELTYSELDREIREWKRVIKDMIPQNNLFQLLRPPHGQLDLKTLWYAWKNNWTIALWSIDTRDLDGMSLEENIGYLESINIKGGDIILFHDDAKCIEGLLEWLTNRVKSQGLRFCKMSEIITKK